MVSCKKEIGSKSAIHIAMWPTITYLIKPELKVSSGNLPSFRTGVRSKQAAMDDMAMNKAASAS